MFASICRRSLRRFRQIPSAAGGADPSRRPYPMDALLSHGYSLASLAGAPLPEPPCPATVSNLTSCGLSPASTAARNRKHSIRSADKADAVRALFRSYGFTDADITEVVRRASVVLTLNPDRILRPKLDLFASLGVKPRRLSTAPTLFMRSLDNHLVPCVQFLRGVLGTDADVCDAISRSPRVLLADLERCMRPAVAALRGLGLPDEFISELITIEMGVLMISPDRITQIFQYLKLLDLTDRGFLYSFRALCCLSRETWLRKVALYQSFGVSERELLKAFKKLHTVLLYSDEAIKKKLQFYLDELKLEVSDVMRNPVIMGYSLEKCVIPRCAVLSVLMREGKIEPNIKLPAALLGSAKNFFDKYVMRYAHDVPDVVKAYEGKIKFEGFR